jgi:hypothetical protein
MARAEPAAPHPAEALGADLAALVAALPAGVASVMPVTSLAARRSRRASFRIALGDGTAVKGRRFDTAYEAERFARLTRHLAHPQIPAAIAQRGTAVIEPWTDGKSLDGRTVTAEEARALGASLASIHVASPPAGSQRDLEAARTERRDRLTVNIDRLTQLGCIDSAFAARIRAGAEPLPADVDIGLIHGDFCPENFVRANDGRIVAVDNETLRFEALDYDLARAWYRWRMSDTQACAFLDGYRATRSPDGFLRHFPYWAICALVDSATFRATAEIGGVEQILRRLDAFVRARPSFPDGGDAP